jgi:predicted ester cyclase
MSSIRDTAERFFDACETRKGWEECAQYCHTGATFAAQADALNGVETLEAYTEWMKHLLALLPDGNAEVRSFAVDEARNNVAAFGVFRGTHTGGGPLPPTGDSADGGRGGGQPRRQRFPGHRPARAQLFGVAEAAAGLPQRNPQPAGQHPGQGGGAQRGGVGLAGQPGGQPLLDRGQRPADSFEPVQLGQQLGVAESVDRGGLQGGQPGGDHVDRGHQRVAVGIDWRLHASNTSATHRQKGRPM